MRDYAQWHDEYDTPGSRLHLRLLVVQELISRALDQMPPGPIHVISLCAGQGRDIITVARRHRRGSDLRGRLVELDPTNVGRAKAAIAAAGLTGLEALEGDAGRSDAYEGATPADLVIACGVFGNISDEDVRNFVEFVPSLCAPGAWAVWTRHPRVDGFVETVQDWFTDAGFEARALVVPEGKLFGVGAAQLVAEPAPFRPGVRLFDFVR